MLVGRPHVHASGEPLLMGTIGTYLQVHPGVFLTLSRRLDGQNQLTRIRFSRQQFSKDTAEEWWQEHKQEIAMRYNLASLMPST
eukprot:jgi/Astpho2/924/Aster-x0462